MLSLRRIMDLTYEPKTVFTRSAITRPKMNEFGWNRSTLSTLLFVGGWPWQILGAIRAAARVWEATISTISRCTNFYEIWTEQRRSVRRWKVSDRIL